MTKISMLQKSALFPNYQKYQSQILMTQVEDSNQDCVNILRPFL